MRELARSRFGAEVAGAVACAGAAGKGVGAGSQTQAVARAGDQRADWAGVSGWEGWSGAGSAVAGRPLLAAKGAVAQVPTQWSGGGAA